MVIFHSLHQTLDLAGKFPEKERKSVLFRNGAWIFPPKRSELEASVALTQLHELVETLRLRDKELPACSGELLQKITLGKANCVFVLKL